MFFHYLKIALRFIARNKIIATINIAGFTIGIAAGLMIYLWVDDELHFDAFHRNAKNIYRVVQLEKSGNIFTKNAHNSPRLGEEMQKKYPQIIDNTYIRQNSGYKYFLSKGNYINAMTATVDKNFFTFFNFSFAEGKTETAFIDEKSIVISEKFARKLFGKEPALGKEATMSDFFNAQNHFRIGGVVKLPHNTHLSFDVALQKDIQSYASSGIIYLRFDERAKMNEQTKEALSLFLSENARSNNLLTFQPLKDIHLDSGFTHFTDQNPGNMQYVVVFSIW